MAPQRDRPAVVAGFLLGYGLVNLGFGWRYGEQWFARGDAFEVYSTLAGARPLGRLLGVEPAPGLVAFLAVWWGSTVFDGLTGWVGWAAVGGGIVVDTGVLVGLVALVAGLYLLATGRLAAQPATTLVPIAAGYTIAHYATLLLVEGPRGLAQLVGQELGPVTAVPAPAVVAAIQIGAVLVGHVAAIVAAHDRSVALLPEHRRLADQIPLVLLMVAYTMAGLFLLVIS